MNKNVLIALIVLVVVILIGIAGFALLNGNKENNNTENNGNTNQENTNNNGENTNSGEDDNTSEGSKTLVVYFSAQGHTEEVANQIADNLNADIFEIIPEDPYTEDDLDWTDDNSRVSEEHNDESLRDVALETTEVPDWDSYDRILIGYPIWWGVSAWPVSSFVAANDFTGKTVIPFCTSASSGLGESGDLLEEVANGGNWLEGKRFSSNPSNDEIKEWTDSLTN